MTTKTALTAMLMLFGAASFSAQAGDAAAGEGKAQTCAGCHGPAVTGYFNVYPTYNVPRLWGQTPEFIVAALQAYKNGQRTHETMVAQASSMSNEDMADIAAYFTSQPADSGSIEGTAPDSAQVCAACHGAGGAAPVAPTNPILAGQHKSYLIEAMKSYKDGRRNNPIMGAQMANLSDADIKELAEWFSSQVGLRESNE